ncbi:GLPGLI family protein [Sphingobacterium sp. lm-10]|uniref:GLPGLI family protein n=1 Tax=Sphingobacterium sp. lm-10 TaxID=2944904 RepID=UPI0020206418|nr:GLPGLI family protein [Sphingobacterium sp. lm-10]MCL7988912.1 GLPGLI family protein [Sphingobacterium sp. lm-10]
MRTFFLTTTLLLAASIGVAQSFIISYEERANIENQLKNVTDPQARARVSAHLSNPRQHTLYYQNGESLYVSNQDKATEEDLSVDGGSNIKTITLGQNVGGLYKNHQKNEFLHEGNVLGKVFLVTDRLEPYNWQLAEEEKQIGPYLAHKATTKVDDKDIIAWYTLEFPIQDGPKDYYGLPGLIIELHAPKMSYHATAITPSQSVIEIVKPSKGEKTTRAKYKKTLENKISELKRNTENPPF